MITEVKPKTTELKPCPFCGERVKLFKWNATGVYWVECENPQCKMRPTTDASTSVRWVVGAWNKRA